MKRIAGLVMILTVAVWTGTAQADVTGTMIGALHYPNYQGSGAIGYIDPWYEATRPPSRCAQFGVMWDGPVEISSFTLTQAPDDIRQRPHWISLYISPTECIGTFELADTQDAQTITFPPVLAKNAYVMVVVENRGDDYPSALWREDNTTSGNYASWGVMDCTFAATPKWPGGIADVNVNLTATISSSRGPDYSAVSGFGCLADGVIVNTDYLETPFWYWAQSGALELTATYATAQAIGSIGLGFVGDPYDRAYPEYVDVYVTYDDNSTSDWIHIPLDGFAFTQYWRYEFDAPFENVQSLTVVLPTGVDGAWQGTDSFFGLTEFQAFAPRVPEPATMALLTLGGLAMLRRRK